MDPVRSRDCGAQREQKLKNNKSKYIKIISISRESRFACPKERDLCLPFRRASNGMENKKLLVLWIVVALVVGCVGGYYLGNTIGFSNGKEAANTQLSGIVGLVFPKPAEEIHSVAGTITAISGATLTLEVNDPEDYLPHVDGTSQKTMMRYASLTGSAKIILVDSTKVDANGNTPTTELQPSDLKVGDNVMVQSNQNIRTESNFDVVQVQMVKY